MSIELRTLGSLTLICIAPGCIDYVGFPPSSLYGHGFFPDTGEILQDDDDCDLWESEPNDYDQDSDWDNFGVLHPDRAPLRLCGSLSSASHDQDGYFTGDRDAFYFKAWQTGTVTFAIAWDSTDTDLYCCYLGDDGIECVETPTSLTLSVQEDLWIWIILTAWEGDTTGYQVTYEAQ